MIVTTVVAAVYTITQLIELKTNTLRAIPVDLPIAMEVCTLAMVPPARYLLSALGQHSTLRKHMRIWVITAAMGGVISCVAVTLFMVIPTEQLLSRLNLPSDRQYSSIALWRGYSLLLTVVAAVALTVARDMLDPICRADLLEELRQVRWSFLTVFSGGRKGRPCEEETQEPKAEETAWWWNRSDVEVEEAR
ncbi:hypothetical protein CSOJ01_12878 [Colletotrichum sojae]|uniref:Uncharacterized protein n=1 Tax=Colletotrichum sojae TaxID=2175907 RepID=A0A8H6IUC5_9PEZI|nr:hypothetical protein CSOJ01_12878 [Colletotrichum sojae]